MKWTEGFWGVFATIGALYFIAVNFSAEESRFECAGELVANGESRPATVFMRLERYRWWVGLWSESYGSVALELPNMPIEHISSITEGGDYLQFWDRSEDYRGMLSTLGYSLSVSFMVFGSFSGTCRVMAEPA